jgi:hypothetical protein
MVLSAKKNEAVNWDEFCEKAAAEERVIFEYKGRKLALISAEDLDYLETLEDRYDNEACDRILKEMEEKGEKPIPYELIRKELGLE